MIDPQICTDDPPFPLLCHLLAVHGRILAAANKRESPESKEEIEKKKPKKSGKKEALDEMRYIDIETAGIEEEEQ